MDSSERLCRIADIIELEPQLYDQSIWTKEDIFELSLGQGECGTRACIAGWAVRLTPKEERTPWPAAGFNPWMVQGAVSLGLDPELAARMFRSEWDPGHVLPEILRTIAKMPEGERTLERVEAVLLDLGIEGCL